MAAARQPGLPPQRATVASSRERFPVPEAFALRAGSKAQQAAEAPPFRPSHDAQAARSLPPGMHMMEPREKAWPAGHIAAAAYAPPPSSSHVPPHSASAQRFPLPDAYALKPGDVAREKPAQSGMHPPHALPPQSVPAQRFPVLDAQVLKPTGQPKEGAPQENPLCLRPGEGVLHVKGRTSSPGVKELAE